MLFLQKHSVQGPIFNDYDSGSYLIRALYPKEQVFFDNRPEAYPASFIKETYLPMLEYEEIWKQKAKEYRFNAIVFYRYDEAFVYYFTARRIQDPEWVLVFSDTYHVIFLRNIPENKALIDQFGITPINAEAKLHGMITSPLFDDQVAAADTLTLLQRLDLALPLYTSVTKKWPHKGRIWMTIGKLELLSNTQKDTVSAIMHLEKAIDLNFKTADTYYFLAVAYMRTNEGGKAKEAIRHAVAIDPQNQIIKKLQTQIYQYAPNINN